LRGACEQKLIKIMFSEKGNFQHLKSIFLRYNGVASYMLYQNERAAGHMRREMPALIPKPLADSKKRHARAHAADRSAAEALGTVCK